MVDKEIILSKIDKSANKLNGKFPHITKDGIWQTNEDGFWTGGFWIGILWWAYLWSKNDKYKNWAYEYLELLKNQIEVKTLDLGFLFYPSFVLGYQITKDIYLKKVSLQACDNLLAQFNGKFFGGWWLDDEEKPNHQITTIDTMTNLSLIWWAYEETKEKKYLNVCIEHTKITQKNFLRENGSTAHVVEFKIPDGKKIKEQTHQGYNHNSCWSRGQAWALYGFAKAYNVSKEEGFLATAMVLADYFIKNLPIDFVPYYDFEDPNIPDVPKDSSAAVIAACGLLDLAKELDDYRQPALNILNSLTQGYLTSQNHDGILTAGCYHLPLKEGINCSTIWGDYYYLEALSKLDDGSI
ncbi:MAG: glycoside hydrolase family 88 protein [bacterium]